MRWFTDVTIWELFRLRALQLINHGHPAKEALSYLIILKKLCTVEPQKYGHPQDREKMAVIVKLLSIVY